MMCHLLRLHFSRPLAVGLGLVLFSGIATAGEPAVEGYTDYDAYRGQLKAIAASEFAALESLGRTLGKREVFVLKIGAGKLDEKPAVLIVGGVHPPHLLGSELAVRTAQRIVEQAKTDKAVRKLLERVTFYVIPRPAPDACEAFFRRPYFERAGNERPVDDDRDGEVDEDGPDDLNGDGWITMMRVEDRTGSYMPHPDDARVMIEADPKLDEQGRYRLLVEGRDNDGDEQQGEDPAGGVAFNRNFTFRYPYFQQGAGPHQVSEPETRAVADFAYDHPNIAMVLSFTPEDNLMEPWKPDSSSESKKITSAVLSDDAPYFDFIAEQYREIHGGKGKDAPKSPEGEGSFSEWAYFHYGRWSFGCRGWWIPEVEEEKSEEGGETKEGPSEQKSPEKATSDEMGPDEKTPGEKAPEEEPSPEERGTEDLNALRWFAREKIDGFVDWQQIEHPDFPGKRVEVGGFKPFVRCSPPAGQLKPLAEKHWQFVRKLVELLPRVEISKAEAEPLGNGVWRLKTVVVNRGYLPTVSQMGHKTRQPHVLQIAFELPKGAALLTGHSRMRLPTLAGHGGKVEHTCVLQAPRGKPASLRVRVWSPSVGAAVEEVTLAEVKKSARKKKPAQKEN